MNTTNSLIIALAIAAAAPLSASAAEHSGMAGMQGMENMKGMSMGEPKAGQEALSEGEVRKVDSEQGKLTIKHGPLQNLGMPGMTMIFRVADPGFLGKVKPGDKIKFKAEKIDGAFTVTQLEK